MFCVIFFRFRDIIYIYFNFKSFDIQELVSVFETHPGRQGPGVHEMYGIICHVRGYYGIP